MVAELLRGQVDVVVANRVRWGTQSTLIAALSHFPELEAKLELLGSRSNAVQMEVQVDALWTLARSAWDSLALYILPSVARCPPDDARE
jgi:hypothetical protein